MSSRKAPQGIDNEATNSKIQEDIESKKETQFPVSPAAEGANEDAAAAAIEDAEREEAAADTEDTKKETSTSNGKKGKKPATPGKSKSKVKKYCNI